MKVTRTCRGFEGIWRLPYGEASEKEERLVQQSSAIGDYDDSFAKPGSSFLWIDTHHHLDREEVAEFRDALTRWLETSYLSESTHDNH